MSHETNLALATANALTDRKAYDIASWLYDIAQWVHERGEPPTDLLPLMASDKYDYWQVRNIMHSLMDDVEATINNYSSPPIPPIKREREEFKNEMNLRLQVAINKLKGHQDGSDSACQKLIERGKFFFSFWMPEPVAAEVVKIRGGTVEEEGSGAAGYTLTPTASTSPRLTP